MKSILLASAVLGALACAAPARAGPFTVSFTLTNIPESPDVLGSFEYEADSIGQILALDAVNLTIQGFTYTLADIGSSISVRPISRSAA